MIILLSVVAALVVLIIACGATFLVRNIETYSYYVDSPAEYDSLVIEASGIETGTSMFFIDEVAVKNRIEDKYTEVEVINIERKFPDRVSINYIVHEEIFKVLCGTEYLHCYSSGRIGKTSSVTDPLDGCFTVKSKSPVRTEVGAYFQDSDGYDFSLIKRTIDYLRRRPLSDKQIYERVDFIDLTRESGGYTYFYMRTAEGCALELYCADDEFDAMFESLLDDAWSIYSDPDHSYTDDAGNAVYINPAVGTIQAFVVRSGGEARVRTTYRESLGIEYYRENYVQST